MNPTTIGCIGPPGSGKSWFLRSAAEWMLAQGKQVAIALCIPSERDSYPEPGNGLLVKHFHDSKFKPLLEQFESTAFLELYQWLQMVEKNPKIGMVIVDPASTVSDFAMNKSLATYDCDDPQKVSVKTGRPGLAYTEHDSWMRYFVHQLTAIYLSQKFVLTSWHGEMKEMEGVGKPDPVKGMQKDATGQKVVQLQYGEQYLPATATKKRQHIHKDFSLWLSAFTTGSGKGTKWWLRSVPEEGSPAKGRIELNFANPQWSPSKFPNDFAALVAAATREETPNA